MPPHEPKLPIPGAVPDVVELEEAELWGAVDEEVEGTDAEGHGEAFTVEKARNVPANRKASNTCQSARIGPMVIEWQPSPSGNLDSLIAAGCQCVDKGNAVRSS